MKIKLIRNGGFIPITKVAEIDVDLDEQDYALLLETIKSPPSARRVKDGTNYSLKAGNVVTPIDMEKLPEKYSSLFTKLKKELKAEKKNP